MAREISGPIDGVRLVVDEFGPPDGEAVVWLHSEFGSLGDPPLGELTSVARVIAPHLPGWGVSDDGGGSRRIEDLALLMWWLLDELALDAVALAGHGFGATLAAEMAVQQPTRVKSLTLAAPFGIVDADQPGADIFALTPRDLLPQLYGDPDGDIATGHYPKPADAHESGLAAIRRVQVLGSASRYLFPLPDTGIADRAYRLDAVPTQLVFGADDGVVPAAIAPRWQRAIPHAQISILDAAAHMHPYESNAFQDVLQLALLGEPA